MLKAIYEWHLLLIFDVKSLIIGDELNEKRMMIEQLVKNTTNNILD
jgi:hypothetical protein